MNDTTPENPSEPNPMPTPEVGDAVQRAKQLLQEGEAAGQHAPHDHQGQPTGDAELPARLLWDVGEQLRWFYDEALPKLVNVTESYHRTIDVQQQSQELLLEIARTVAERLEQIEARQAEIADRMEALELKL